LLYTRAEQLQQSKGGNAQIGRRLVRILREAGFERLDLDVMVVHSDLVGMAEMAPLWDEDGLWPAVRAGLVTKAEYALVRENLAAFYASPDAISMYTLLFAAGAKPDGD
jgi:hypothetical protein